MNYCRTRELQVQPLALVTGSRTITSDQTVHTNSSPFLNSFGISLEAINLLFVSLKLYFDVHKTEKILGQTFSTYVSFQRNGLNLNHTQGVVSSQLECASTLPPRSQEV